MAYTIVELQANHLTGEVLDQAGRLVLTVSPAHPDFGSIMRWCQGLTGQHLSVDPDAEREQEIEDSYTSGHEAGYAEGYDHGVAAGRAETAGA